MLSRTYIVISGPPGSGKSSMATLLAQHLQLALIAKDVIKEAIGRVLPIETVEPSRIVGGAAVEVLLTVAAASPSAVLDSVWHRSRAVDQLMQLPGAVVEVHLSCDHHVLRQRYRQRAESRGGGHFDAERTEDELWNPDTMSAVAGGWPVIEVDTTNGFDLDSILLNVRAHTSQH